MSKPIDDIAKYLQANNIGTLKTDLFETYQPDKPDACIAILDTGGFEPDSYLPTGDPTFQILVRSIDYTTGKAKVDAIVNLLHLKANIQLVTDGVYFYYIKLMQEPVHLGRDKNERDEFSINLRTHIRR
jgi:hypothetical protein